MAESKANNTAAKAENKTETKEKMVTIRLPKTKPDQEDLFVSINMRTWIVKRGVDVEVPECVALAIRDSEDMMNEIFDKAQPKKK